MSPLADVDVSGYATGELIDLAAQVLGCLRRRFGPNVEQIEACAGNPGARWADPPGTGPASGDAGVSVWRLSALSGLWDTARAVALLTDARLRHTAADSRELGRSLEDHLTASGPLPGVEVRRQHRAGLVIGYLPHLSAAVADGLVGGSTLVVLCGLIERLKLSQRPMVDALFTDRVRISKLSADELVEVIAEAVERLRADLADHSETAARERRRVSTRMEGGSLIGFFELDGEAGATLLEALNAAAPAPSAGPRDTTRHAIGQRDPDEPDDPDQLWALRARQRQHADALLRLAEHYLTHNPSSDDGSSSSDDDDDGDTPSPADDTHGHSTDNPATSSSGDADPTHDRDTDGAGNSSSHSHGTDDPADSSDGGDGDAQGRSCVGGATGTGGRDAGRGAGGSSGRTAGRPGRTHNPDAAAAAAAAAARRRSRPRMLVWADLGLLTGDTDQARAARLLTNHIGGPVRLTPEAALRLSSDATIRMILHDEGRILGSTDAQATITLTVREAVFARDQGCRFPGCTAPVQWCDLHHVIARHRGGPTIPENLVSLCRRHHTAVTNGRWRLEMTVDAVVTVSRGRQRATSLPPHHRQLHPKAHPD